MKRNNFLYAGMLLLAACGQNATVSDPDIYSLENPVDTLLYEQAPFEWHVTPRHDYSKTYVTKLFMSQALFDPEYMGRFKMRDNGQQTNFLNCEQALDIIKGMDAITLGLPKIVYLVGWQYLGHDSKYPAFFEGNAAIKRPQDKDALESLRWLMDEGKKCHTAVSLHINLMDAYPDSPLFDEYVKENVLAKEENGDLVHSDWGYKICYSAEWKKGLLQKRLDSLFSLLPITDAGTLHVDAFHNDVPEPYVDENGEIQIRSKSPISPWHAYTMEQDMETQRNIAKYLDGKGVDVTIEGEFSGHSMDGYFPMYWHYGGIDHVMSLKASQSCGGNNYVPAFGRNINGEGLFREVTPIDAALVAFKKEFCKQTLICQYLNNFGRVALIRDDKDNSIGVLEDGVRTMVKDDIMYVAKDGQPLVEGGDVFVPAGWLGDNAIIAFSENGYENKTWTVPAGVNLSGQVKAWLIDANGRTEFKTFQLRKHQLTLSLAPGEMVLIQG